MRSLVRSAVRHASMHMRSTCIKPGIMSRVAGRNITESYSQRMAQCQDWLDHLLTIHVRHCMHRQQPPSLRMVCKTLNGLQHVKHRNSLGKSYSHFPQKLAISTNQKRCCNGRGSQPFAIGTSDLWLNDSRPAIYCECQFGTARASHICLWHDWPRNDTVGAALHCELSNSVRQSLDRMAAEGYALGKAAEVQPQVVHVPWQAAAITCGRFQSTTVGSWCAPHSF